MKIEKEFEVGLGDMAVLNFELTGIQTAIKKAVLMRANGLTELIDAEVRKAFTHERIMEAIKTAVEQEFQNSMRYGEGAKIVREIVSKQVAKTIEKLSKD